MILVQVQQTWLQVLTGSTTADEAIMEGWPDIAERDLRHYGDVLVGLYRNTVVGVYDIDLEKTTYVQGKVRFAGTPSQAWAKLVGKANPGEEWGPQGHGGPVQYLDTAVVARGGGAARATEAPGIRQTVLDGFVLSVDGAGNAAVVVPAGRTLTMRAAHSVGTPASS